MIFNPQEFTLENGMRCLVIENHMTPAVYHSVWVQVGGADEPMGHSGIAHFLEHLMFRGTEKVGPGEYDKIINGLGGQNNAFTSQDVTNYYVKISKENLGKVMELESERLVGLKITPELFDTEKQVILEERKSRVDNDPFGQFYEQMRAQLFQHHPYKIPVIGWEHEIKGLTREEVMNFYHHHYAPNNAILIVGGDVTLPEVKALAEKYYGPLKSVKQAQRFRTDEPPAIAEKRMTLRHSQIQQEQFMRMYRLPAAHTMDQVDVASLEILSELLAGTQTSPLYLQLVVDGKQALNINTSYTSNYRDAAFFHISAMPAPNVPVEKLEELIDQHLQSILKKGFSQEDVDRTKKKLTAESIYARDSLSQGPELFGHVLSSLGKLSDIEDWEKILSQVTPERIQKLSQKLLDLKMSITGYLKPEAQQTPKAA